MSRIVRVALPLPRPRLFDYLVGPEARPEVGHCVRLPFGTGEKTGVIISIDPPDSPPLAKLKPILELLAEIPPLPAQWLALTQFAARYYQHPLGEVISAALPPGIRRAVKLPRDDDPWLATTAAGRTALAERISTPVRPERSAAKSKGAPSPPKPLTRALAAVEAVQAAGARRRSELLRDLAERSPACSPSTSSGHAELPPAESEASSEQEDAAPPDSAPLHPGYELYQGRSPALDTPAAQALGPNEIRAPENKASTAASAAIREARAKGWLETVSRAGEREPIGALTLNAAQATAVTEVNAAAGCFKPFLLFGVTGSGKTEVYLHQIAHTLAQGKQALMLVPEIGLTPQLMERVASRFPGANLVSLHSGMADGARSLGFVQALKGEADIVLGTRLSVFVPLPRLGLIVIDEEHDASFKQQDGLRYSARDLAVWRANYEKLPIVLGSATPSLETWLHAEAKRYTRLDLPLPAVADKPPSLRRIDTRRVKLDNGLSPGLIEGIRTRIERGEQSLVFLNRRGYAPVIACPQCNWISACPHCSANMVFHAADRSLRCHHCGHEDRVPHICPGCGNQDLHAFGRGTQRLEERLREHFPDARIERVDRDAIRTPAQWEEVRGRIEAREIDLLVGTQMLAKGHDFPMLTLVGIVGADAGLYAADYRAPERLFQQLMQVAGRSGRGELPGEVLVQTEFPEHPLYEHLARRDYPGFAKRELAERRLAGFPPYGFHAVLRAEAPELDTAVVFLQQARAAAEALQSPARLFDVVPMRLVRKARLERAQLVIEADTRPSLQAMLTELMPLLYALKLPKDLRWHIDVDPGEL